MKRIAGLIGLAGMVATGLAFAVNGNNDNESDAVTVEVNKTESCSCCGQWVEHVQDAGFDVETHNTSHRVLQQMKRDAGLDFSLASCHTAFVDGYVIEGHVPAGEIRRLLEERPDVAGLTVPGMPVGSPGMEMGDRQDEYEVLIFTEDGETEVFATYPQEN